LELTPSEPIMGEMGDSANGKYVPFLIETYKAWNKMHDPSTDGSLDHINYNLDVVLP
jgi:hypothetical protein